MYMGIHSSMCSRGHFLKCPHSPTERTGNRPERDHSNPLCCGVNLFEIRRGREQARGGGSEALWRFPSAWKGNLVVLASCKWAKRQHGQILAFRGRRRTAVLVGSERTLARLLCSVADVVNGDKIISHGRIRIICFKAFARGLFFAITTVFRARCCICGLRISAPVC